MIQTLVLLVLAGVTLGSCALSDTPPSRDSSRTPLPVAAVQTPRDLTALLGTWQGSWNGRVPIRLVVEDLRGSWATVSYTFADPSKYQVPGGPIKTTFRVAPDGRIAWAFRGNIHFTLSEDGNTLVGTRLQSPGEQSITLSRVEPAHQPVSATATATR